jgi:predicted permease
MDGAMFEAVRDRVPSLDVAVMGGGGGVNLVLNGTPVFAKHSRVSEGFSRVLGVTPVKGRWFSANEDKTGGPQVTVLSFEAWQRYFAGAEDVIGRAVLLRGEPHQIVGVMPAGFRSVDGATFDLWVPLRPSTSGEGGGDNFWTVARLKPGASWAQAKGELLAVRDAAFRLQRAQEHLTRDLSVQPMAEILATRIREPIVLLSSAALAVLLIACVNLAALMLVRADGRTHEIATRMALGGGRRVVVRQLMVEAGVIAGVGGVAGLLIGYLGLHGLQALGGEAVRRMGSCGDRWARGRARHRALGAGEPGFWSGAGHPCQPVECVAGAGRRARRRGPGLTVAATHLVISEVAIGVVLLVATGLLVRTFVNVRALDPGFDRSNLVTASVSLRDARYNNAASINQLFDQSLRRLAATPGVESVAISLEVPYERLLNLGFRYTDAVSTDTSMTNLTYVTPAFIKTMGIDVKSGRDFTDADRAGAPAVALVNEAFQRMYSKDQPAVGRAHRCRRESRDRRRRRRRQSAAQPWWTGFRNGTARVAAVDSDTGLADLGFILPPGAHVVHARVERSGPGYARGFGGRDSRHS